MLRAYQLSMVRAPHENHTNGPWSLKDRTDQETGPGARGRTVSTHILGVGIALVGVLLLAIGLIMGLEFPKYIHEQNKEDQCVVHSDHSKYREWKAGSQWKRRVHAYYWTLTNAEKFQRSSETPQFYQKGPYVYTETETKHDVTFAVTEVTFRRRHRFHFDSEATLEACSSCREDDRLTILSPWYLKTVGQAGGEQGLGWTLIPAYTRYHLIKEGYAHMDADAGLVFHPSISQLGNFSADLGQPIANISFGTWLQDNSCLDKSKCTLGIKNELTPTELKSLYTVLTNLTLLGGEALSKADKMKQQKCQEWAESMCPTSLHHKVKGVSEEDCGIIYLLHKCHNSSSNSVKDIFHRTFCPPSGDVCLNVTGLPESLMSLVFHFITDVSQIVLDTYLSSMDLTLVTSRNQSQLALGYDVTGDDIFGSYHVTGLLHLMGGGEENGSNSLWTLYTCLKDRDMNNNMKLKAYNNNWAIPEGLLRKPSYKSSISSHTDFLASCQHLQTCVSCSSTGSSVKIFLEDLLRPTTFVYNSSTTVDGVDVKRYGLDDDTFSNSSRLTVTDGVQDMTGVAGYLSWISLPYMAGATTDHFVVRSPTTIQHSYILVEPVTGRVWKKNVQMQLNVGIGQETANQPGSKISVVGRPLPVFWTDRLIEINSEEIDSYKHLVSRLMSVSCGGLIGFSVVAVIVVIIGFVVCVYPSKPNRIAPLVEETTNSIPVGRHV